MHTRKKVAALACSLALTAGSFSGLARDTGGDQSKQQPSQKQSSQKQQSQQQSSSQLQPEAWVRIAYDLDRDGSFEAVEYINYYDLERARNDSQRRRQQDQKMSQQDRSQRDRRQMSQQDRSQRDRRQMSQQDRSQRDSQFVTKQQQNLQSRNRGNQQAATYRVQGRITNLRSLELAGKEGTHLLAKIRTQDGRIAKVDLGRERNLRNVDLQQGDRVTVTGKIGQINGRALLMATRINAQGRTITAQRGESKKLQRAEGEILRTATVDIGSGRDARHVIALVDFQDGPQRTVILGKEKEIPTERLSENQQASFLIRQVQIDGQNALLAEEFKVGNRSTNVEWENPRQNIERVPTRFQQQRNR